jgi:dihydrofolate reductase
MTSPAAAPDRARKRPTITSVAAVARNGVIGDRGDIPWRLPGEQAAFKQLTMGHVLVMGRLTYDSIGRPLPGRTTVVVTRQPGWQPPGGPRPDVLVATSVEEALERAAELDDQVFVVGGGEIYTAAMPVADVLRVTWVDQEPDGDAFFPAIDPDVWEVESQTPYDGYTVTRYERASRR